MRKSAREYRKRNKDKCNEASRKSYQKNLEENRRKARLSSLSLDEQVKRRQKKKEYRNRYRKEGREKSPNPQVVRKAKLKRYGLTIEQFDSLKAKQKGKCSICNKVFKTDKRDCHIDHNHFTGEVRGLLCAKCNRGLGMFRDDKEIIKAAIKYLESYCD